MYNRTEKSVMILGCKYSTIRDEKALLSMASKEMTETTMMD